MTARAVLPESSRGTSFVLLLCLAAPVGCQNNARVTSTIACNPTTCGGCCDDRGMCVEGKSLDACGIEGVSCVACSFGAACSVGDCRTPIVDAGAPDAGEPDAGHTPCPPDGWCADTSNTTAALRSVWAISPTNVWAAGDQGTVIHFDGAGWKPIATGATEDFSAVWASGPNDVWLAGSAGDPAGNNGVLLRYDGTQWSTVKRGTKRLTAIWGTGGNDVWVVGDLGASFHWDGTQLTSIPTGTTLDLVDLGGTSKSQVWAVGASGALLAWDGSAWKKIPTGILGGFTSVVALSPTLAWVMGGNGQFFRYDGTTWAGSNLGMDHNVLGLWASSPTQAFGVGPAGELVSFNGVSLVTLASPSTELLRDVHGCDASHAWAVGFKGAVLRYVP